MPQNSIWILWACKKHARIVCPTNNNENVWLVSDSAVVAAAIEIAKRGEDASVLQKMSCLVVVKEVRTYPATCSSAARYIHTSSYASLVDQPKCTLSMQTLVIFAVIIMSTISREIIMLTWRKWFKPCSLAHTILWGPMRLRNPVFEWLIDASFRAFNCTLRVFEFLLNFLVPVDHKFNIKLRFTQSWNRSWHRLFSWLFTNNFC